MSTNKAVHNQNWLTSLQQKKSQKKEEEKQWLSKTRVDLPRVPVGPEWTDDSDGPNN